MDGILWMLFSSDTVPAILAGMPTSTLAWSLLSKKGLPLAHELISDESLHSERLAFCILGFGLRLFGDGDLL